MTNQRKMQAGRGLFIAVEGCDGSGKGSLIERLSGHLASAGHDLLVTREPGGTQEGLALRALLLSAEGSVWDQGAELLLMTAARIQHVKRVIQPALAAGRTVLCDRYVGSTLAYQGAGRGVSQDLIRTLHRQLVEDLWPDLTLLLDVAPATGLKRSRARLGSSGLDEGRFENLETGFHERVRADFLAQAQANPSSTRVIDANGAMEQVHQQALDALDAWLSCPGDA